MIFDSIVHILVVLMHWPMLEEKPFVKSMLPNMATDAVLLTVTVLVYQEPKLVMHIKKIGENTKMLTVEAISLEFGG